MVNTFKEIEGSILRMFYSHEMMLK